eukprot:533638_1
MEESVQDENKRVILLKDLPPQKAKIVSSEVIGKLKELLGQDIKVQIKWNRNRPSYYFIEFLDNNAAVNGIDIIRSSKGLFEGAMCEMARIGRLQRNKSKARLQRNKSKARLKRKKIYPADVWRNKQKAKRARRAQRKRDAYAAQHQKEAKDASESSVTEPSSGPDEN